jgi:hypothetical protein
MGLVSELAARVGTYIGTVDGIESGPCIARLAIGVLPNGGVSIDYEATTREDGLKHREHSLLSEGPDGADELIAALSDVPFLLKLRRGESGRFVESTAFGPYEIEIEINVTPKAITYAYWWANRGETLIEQSRATVTTTTS